MLQGQHPDETVHANIMQADDIMTALEPLHDANRLALVVIDPLSLYWQEHDNRTVAA